jgi:hypothetical protein
VRLACPGYRRVGVSPEGNNEPARHECKPRIHNVGSGAENVGLEHAPESINVSQKGGSSASRVLNQCEPLQVADGIPHTHGQDLLYLSGE